MRSFYLRSRPGMCYAPARGLGTIFTSSLDHSKLFLFSVYSFLFSIFHERFARARLSIRGLA